MGKNAKFWLEQGVIWKTMMWIYFWGWGGLSTAWRYREGLSTGRVRNVITKRQLLRPYMVRPRNPVPQCSVTLAMLTNLSKPQFSSQGLAHIAHVWITKCPNLPADELLVRLCHCLSISPSWGGWYVPTSWKVGRVTLLGWWNGNRCAMYCFRQKLGVSECSVPVSYVFATVTGNTPGGGCSLSIGPRVRTVTK